MEEVEYFEPSLPEGEAAGGKPVCFSRADSRKARSYFKAGDGERRC